MMYLTRFYWVVFGKCERTLKDTGGAGPRFEKDPSFGKKQTNAKEKCS